MAGTVGAALKKRMPALLELFKGTGSVGRAFKAEGWEVVSLDLLPKFEPSICCNILQWDYRAAFPPGHFQFVWASPVCTEYSRALTTRPLMPWCFEPSKSSHTFGPSHVGH